MKQKHQYYSGINQFATNNCDFENEQLCYSRLSKVSFFIDLLIMIQN
jgi:hypothetical protein